jgi:hypothetical protein
MDRFLTGFDKASRKVEQIAETMDPLNPRDQMEFSKATIELKMRDQAAGTAVSSRHSLLKKIIGEIH